MYNLYITSILLQNHYQFSICLLYFMLISLQQSETLVLTLCWNWHNINSVKLPRRKFNE